MRVRMETWKGSREMGLVEALTPERECYGGSLEQASTDAGNALACLGRLTALLVEKGVIDLQEGKEAMGIYHNIEKIT